MKKPKIDKPAKEPKAPKGEPKRTDVAGSNTMDPQKRALFLSDKDKYAKAIERQKSATAAVRNAAKTIKADGFSMRQIKLAIQLETPEGEAEFRSLIANDLLAAQYQGAAIGAQLSLFLEPDRTPAVDMAYDEGQKDAMEGKSAKPGYDPSTAQHARYMDGFHDVTAKRIAGGIGKLEKPDADGVPPRASDMN